MVTSWIVYLLALAAAAAFRMAYTGWLAGVVLVMTAWTPLVGVLASLPAMLGARLTLSAEPERVERGQEARWRIAVTNGVRLPLTRVRGRVEARNALTGECEKKKFRLAVPGGGAAAECPAGTGHCGLLTGELKRVWALDCLGLFWLPLGRDRTQTALLVLPGGEAGEEPQVPQEEAPGLRPRPGGGPGEDYDPREYRPGDPINTIHWKLSAKRDQLIVRETLEDIRAVPLFTFDHFGTPEELDRVLGRLWSLGRALLDLGRGFAVAWAQAETGEVRRFAVADEEGLLECFTAILSESAPRTGRSILDLPGDRRAVHLTAEGGGEDD